MNSVSELSARLLTELAASQQEQDAALPDVIPRRAPIDPASLPVRHSRLKRMAQSPAHAYSSVQLGDDWDDTLSKRLGRATHALVFGQPIHTFTGKVRRGKEWDAFALEHRGECIVNEKERSKSEAVAKALRANPLAEQVLFAPGTMHEQRIDWTWMGRACRSTPDAHTKSHLVDLKTARTADPQRFQWDGARMSYHSQLAFYQDAMAAKYGYPPKRVYIVAIEPAEPYAVTVFEVAQNALDMGRRANRLWMERWLGCEASNHWPAYCESIVPFDVADPDVALIFEEDES